MVPVDHAPAEHLLQLVRLIDYGTGELPAHRSDRGSEQLFQISGILS